LAISREIGNKKNEMTLLASIGLTYANLGNANRTIEYFDQALETVRIDGKIQEEAEILFKMSLALDKLGDRVEAIDKAKSTLAIFEQIESPLAEKVKQKLAEWQSSGEPEN
jgi:tetratricopeptide (TPR) repeat protein